MGLGPSGRGKKKSTCAQRQADGPSSVWAAWQRSGLSLQGRCGCKRERVTQQHKAEAG